MNCISQNRSNRSGVLLKSLFSILFLIFLFLILISPVSPADAQRQKSKSLKKEGPKTEKPVTGRQLGGVYLGEIEVVEVNFIFNTFPNPQIWIDTSATVSLWNVRSHPKVERRVAVLKINPATGKAGPWSPLNPGDEMVWSIQHDNTTVTYDDLFVLEFASLPPGDYVVVAVLKTRLLPVETEFSELFHFTIAEPDDE